MFYARGRVGVREGREWMRVNEGVRGSMGEREREEKSAITDRKKRQVKEQEFFFKLFGQIFREARLPFYLSLFQYIKMNGNELKCYFLHDINDITLN